MKFPLITTTFMLSLLFGMAISILDSSTIMEEGQLFCRMRMPDTEQLYEFHDGKLFQLPHVEPEFISVQNLGPRLYQKRSLPMSSENQSIPNGMKVKQHQHPPQNKHPFFNTTDKIQKFNGRRIQKMLALSKGLPHETYLAPASGVLIEIFSKAWVSSNELLAKNTSDENGRFLIAASDWKLIGQVQFYLSFTYSCNGGIPQDQVGKNCIYWKHFEEAELARKRRFQELLILGDNDFNGEKCYG